MEKKDNNGSCDHITETYFTYLTYFNHTKQKLLAVQKMDGLVTFQIMFRLNALSVCCLVKQNHPAIEINNMLHLAAACFKSTVVFFECRFFYLRIKNIKEKEEGI